MLPIKLKNVVDSNISGKDLYAIYTDEYCQIIWFTKSLPGSNSTIAWNRRDCYVYGHGRQELLIQPGILRGKKSSECGKRLKKAESYNYSDH